MYWLRYLWSNGKILLIILNPACKDKLAVWEATFIGAIFIFPVDWNHGLISAAISNTDLSCWVCLLIYDWWQWIVVDYWRLLLKILLWHLLKKVKKVLSWCWKWSTKKWHFYLLIRKLLLWCILRLNRWLKFEYAYRLKWFITEWH